MDKNYIDWVINSSKWLFEETEKRLKYSPFDHNQFHWWLIHSKGPHFFALRDLLRKDGYTFFVTAEPIALTTLENSVVLTAFCVSESTAQVRVRGQWLPRSQMPLYVEAGQWDCPQMNPLFDWTEDQAWAYLIDRKIVLPEDFGKEIE